MTTTALIAAASPGPSATLNARAIAFDANQLLRFTERLDISATFGGVTGFIEHTLEPGAHSTFSWPESGRRVDVRQVEIELLSSTAIVPEAIVKVWPVAPPIAERLLGRSDLEWGTVTIQVDLSDKEAKTREGRAVFELTQGMQYAVTAISEAGDEFLRDTFVCSGADQRFSLDRAWRIGGQIATEDDSVLATVQVSWRLFDGDGRDGGWTGTASPTLAEPSGQFSLAVPSGLPTPAMQARHAPVRIECELRAPSYEDVRVTASVSADGVADLGRLLMPRRVVDFEIAVDPASSLDMQSGKYLEVGTSTDADGALFEVESISGRDGILRVALARDGGVLRSFPAGAGPQVAWSFPAACVLVLPDSEGIVLTLEDGTYRSVPSRKFGVSINGTSEFVASSDELLIGWSWNDVYHQMARMKAAVLAAPQEGSMLVPEGGVTVWAARSRGRLWHEIDPDPTPDVATVLRVQ